jgi:curved DNA-binding protein CbpA
VNRKEWTKIREAADLLGLGEKASLAEVKKAYRRMSKKYHPDLQNEIEQSVEMIKMHKLAEAYQVLLRYCTEYRFSFVPGENEQFEAEDWWLERFGKDDHHWGKGRVPPDKD